MPTDADVLKTLTVAFSGCPRPEHFTDHLHCAECAEYDTVLRARGIVTLQRNDLGTPVVDPLCFITGEGFVYYFPALARVALAEASPADEWCGAQLLGHLVGDGRGNSRVQVCTPAQRGAVLLFLQHLVETRGSISDLCSCTDDLLEATEIWSDAVSQAPSSVP